MRKLEKEFEVDRFDIKTSEKKIFKKYTDTIKAHETFDIRLEENSSEELLSIKEYSVQKIFSLINEFPEEHILFLYLNDIKTRNKKQNQSVDISLPIVELNNQLNSSLMRLSSYEGESPFTKQENIVKENNKNPQFLCIFSILHFIIDGLLLVHLLQFILSKEVRINLMIYNIFILFLIVCYLFLFIAMLVFNRNIWVPWIFI